MESSMTRKSPDEKIMIPYLRKLTREHRQLNRLIDTTKSAIARDELKALKAKIGDGSVTAFMAVSPSLYGRIVPALRVSAT